MGRYASEEVDVPRQLVDAIADVRHDGSPTDWALSVLADEGLRLVGSGSGGVAALAAHLNGSSVFYGLVRTTDVIDNSVTVKFVFISFIGSALPPMKRARVSTLKGCVSEIFSPFHAEMMRATEPSEVTSDAVHELLHEMFGQTRQAPAEADGSIRVGMRRIQMSGIGASAPSRPNNAFSASQAMALPAELSAAVREVRDDAVPTDWALARLGGDGQSLVLAGFGSGGAEALAAHLTADAAYYGIVRVTDMVDRSSTIKFAFLTFLGDGLSPMRRAKASTVQGSVSAVFAPFHAELVGLTDPSEVTRRAVNEAVGAVHGGAVGDAPAGRANGVATAIGGRTSTPTLKTKQGADAPPREAHAAVPPDVLAAVAAVRDNGAPERWVVIGHEAQGLQLRVVASGATDPSEGLPMLMDESAILYALVRTELRLEHAAGVWPRVSRFTLLSWVGEQTPPMRKAKLSTLRGAAVDLLSPCHEAHLNLSTPDEVSEALRKAASAVA